jgi:hypothetical protein
MASKKRGKSPLSTKPRKKRKQTVKCKNGFRFHPTKCRCEPVDSDGNFVDDPETKQLPRKDTDCAKEDKGRQERIKARIQKTREDVKRPLYQDRPDPVTDSDPGEPSVITAEQAKPPTRKSFQRRSGVDSFSGVTLIMESPADINLTTKAKVDDLSSVPKGGGLTQGSEFAPRRTVHIKGTDRLLTFQEWNKYKEVFIKRCIKTGLDVKQLGSIKNEVLGHPDKTEINPSAWIGKWWLPPQREKGFWNTEIGTQPTPQVSPTITSLITFSDFSFTACTPVSWNPCFVATVHEFIRTRYDADRVMAALHNISTAGTPNGNSRHRLWGLLRRAWIKNKKSVFGEEWMLDVFFEGELMKDGNLTKKKVQLNNLRSRRRQVDQLDVSLENTLLRIVEGKKRFVHRKQGSWADKAVWLALVSGARKIEVIFMSQFRKIDHDLLEVLQDLKKIRVGADINQWIRQIGLAKKKDGEFIPSPSLDTPDVYKPLIGGVTSDEFIQVWEECRAEFHELVSEVTGRDPSDVTREEAGDISKTAIASAFRREYKGNNTKLLEWVTGDVIHFHTLRAIYGNISHRVFAKGGTSLSVWVGKVLGHDMSDSGTALFYQTINITEKADVTGENAAQSVIRLKAELEDIIKEARFKLTAIRDLKESITKGDTNPTVKLWSTRDHVDVEVVPNRKRGDIGLDLLRRLNDAGVPITSKNLRALGYGSILISKIHKKISVKRQQ